MPRTLTDVEVEPTTEPIIPIIPPTPRIARAPIRPAPAPVEQPLSDSTLFWIIAPLSLLIAGSTAYLVVRLWLKRSGLDNDELA